ncbi:hypothetical protein K505DRAFT_348244 [Melanomma pulvis-pyrius CBS 109.77]|uniref:Uncharacterized protein n=1 Tax=Melanomma pulvis-pyrius CBS 109.77 TaxID=1314802 RepID=A0A6A6XIT9_9PLEO|nr:hypothetical protein K505DRAFT_348244 [Melanomma pulvis-pyrius CBS 109.77]
MPMRCLSFTSSLHSHANTLRGQELVNQPPTVLEYPTRTTSALTKCSGPYATSLCRHTNQGCSGGSFVKNHCPGPASIQCCVKSASTKPSCSEPAENTCTFYPNCLEKRVKCGASGYPIGYGLKYCKKFTDARPKFTKKGKAWITKTMLCLQRNLVPYATGAKSLTCPKLKEFAFGTHPGCYVSSGVCALPPQDWEVVISTVSLKELFGSVDALKATLQTAGDCVEFYKWLIEREKERSVPQP